MRPKSVSLPPKAGELASLQMFNLCHVSLPFKTILTNSTPLAWCQFLSSLLKLVHCTRVDLHLLSELKENGSQAKEILVSDGQLPC